mmetsp:Transcript_3624/g.8600  ORF Transcript_3624/g.8600 Transcript_3624/m.8600 type:complete len:244 (+) Transcript_3624:653-1384(+)
MDHLIPVSVAQELKLLLPGEAQAHGSDPKTILLLAPHHILALPGCPGPDDRVAVVEGCRSPEPRHVHGTWSPGHDPELAALPGKAPLQLHHIGGRSAGALQHAVDEPACSLAPAVRADGGLTRTRHGLARVDNLVRVLVDQQTEMLPTCLAQLDQRCVLSKDLLLHLQHAAEGVPGSGDVDLVTGMGSWIAIVKDSVIEELTLKHPGASVQVLRPPRAPQAAAPKVAARIGAAKAKGGDPRDA